MQDRKLSDYEIEEKGFRSGKVKEYNPSSNHTVHWKHGNRKESENAVSALYSEELDCYVGNINHKLGDGLSAAIRDMPDEVRIHFQDEIIRHSDLSEGQRERALRLIDKIGIPDFSFVVEPTSVISSSSR